MDTYVFYGLIISCVVVMADILVDAFAPLQRYLIPSQCIRSSNQLQQQHAGSLLLSNKNKIQEKDPIEAKANAGSARIQEKESIRARGNADRDRIQDKAKGNETDAVADHAERRSSRHRRRPKKKRKDKNKSSTKTFPSSGNLPDVYWRAIPMEHLREHPYFLKLPPVVTELTKLEDARNFRQGTWQWDALHQGRCTTSQAVAALGFLEEEAGTRLGIPRAWRRGGRGAFERLKQPALRTLSDMEEELCTDKAPKMLGDVKMSFWKPPRSEHELAFYNYKVSSEELSARKDLAKKFAKNHELALSIRMMWGNSQEATALLVALNFFGKRDPGFRLEEVGMCGAGLQLNQTSDNGLLVGASPDGVLRHSNGTIEALEVKNHCPFHSFLSTTKKSKHKKRFSIGEAPRPIDASSGVFSHYVPQLQMEMFCLGKECRSAVMVRLTAHSGALLLRMKRDDEWIEEMLYWLHKFQRDFVEANRKPQKDFFWNAADRLEQSRYRRFVNKTMEIRTSKVELIATIPNYQIQRMGGATPMFFD